MAFQIVSTFGDQYFFVRFALDGKSEKCVRCRGQGEIWYENLDAPPNAERCESCRGRGFANRVFNVRVSGTGIGLLRYRLPVTPRPYAEADFAALQPLPAEGEDKVVLTPPPSLADVIHRMPGEFVLRLALALESKRQEVWET